MRPLSLLTRKDASLATEGLTPDTRNQKDHILNLPVKISTLFIRAIVSIECHLARASKRLDIAFIAS